MVVRGEHPKSLSMQASFQHGEQSIVHGGRITFCLGANTKGCSTDTQSWYSTNAGTYMANAYGRPFLSKPWGHCNALHAAQFLGN